MVYFYLERIVLVQILKKKSQTSKIPGFDDDGSKSSAVSELRRDVRLKLRATSKHLRLSQTGLKGTEQAALRHQRRTPDEEATLRCRVPMHSAEKTEEYGIKECFDGRKKSPKAEVCCLCSQSAKATSVFSHWMMMNARKRPKLLFVYMFSSALLSFNLQNMVKDKDKRQVISFKAQVLTQIQEQ